MVSFKTAKRESKVLGNSLHQNLCFNVLSEPHKDVYHLACSMVNGLEAIAFHVFLINDCIYNFSFLVLLICVSPKTSRLCP